MPHSLILGSGLVQPRLRDFDVRERIFPPGRVITDENEGATLQYQPSLAAIRKCLPYSIAELAISLFTFALFVNSAILIVAGASLYGVTGAEDADIFGIHALLSRSIGKAAGVVFALALLLSGTTAGIVCTLAGQMVSEGQLKWNIKPWQRRLITRAISIVPSMIVAATVGKKGLSTALIASQVALSCLLPVVSAPLIYFTCRSKYMTVAADRVVPSEKTELKVVVDDRAAAVEIGDAAVQSVSMKNHWITAIVAVTIWVVITVMNVAAIVLTITDRDDK
jgi:metal iron transporter